MENFLRNFKIQILISHVPATAGNIAFPRSSVIEWKEASGFATRKSEYKPGSLTLSLPYESTDFLIFF